MKIGISVATFPTKFGPIMFSGDLNRHLDTIARLGYDGIDLFIKSPHEPGVDAVLQSVRESGLKVAMLAAVGAFVDEGLSLSHPDPKVRQALVERMKGQIELAAELDALVPIGLLRGAEKGDDEQKWLAENLSELLEFAGNRGVEIILEPINRYETRLINSVQDAFDYLERFKLPPLRLLVDVFHMNIEDRSITGSLELAGSRIGHVHFADSNRFVPGEGHLNWTEIIDILHRLGYKGFCSIEAIPGSNPEEDARKGIEFVKQVYREILEGAA